MASGVTDIDYSLLRDRGVRFLVFDKDNTLTLTHADDFYSPEIKALVLSLSRTWRVAMLSNSV